MQEWIAHYSEILDQSGTFLTAQNTLVNRNPNQAPCYEEKDRDTCRCAQFMYDTGSSTAGVVLLDVTPLRLIQMCSRF